MPARDPQTGKYVAESDLDRYDDVEVASFHTGVAVPSTETGTTDESIFQGIGIYELDDLIDRGEEGVLLYAYHRITPNFIDLDDTAPTEVGRYAWWTEISTAETIQVEIGQTIGGQAGTNTTGTNFDTFARTDMDDSVDLIGPPLHGEANQGFRDAVESAGGGAAIPPVQWEGQPADPRFHPRDSIHLSAHLGLDNVHDPGVTLQVAGQHIYGIRES